VEALPSLSFGKSRNSRNKCDTIDWLGRVGFFAPIAAKNKFWNATERNRANNCYDADPFPSRWSERQKSKPISERTNSAKDEKRSSEVAVNTATAKSVHGRSVSDKPFSEQPAH
jgi:hypothetical protein